MQLSLMAILAALFIAGFIGVIIGIYIFESCDNRWRLCMSELPPRLPSILNYPVAFYDNEFGVFVDQAEYHHNQHDEWVTVSEGMPCHPFAWYDLPSPPMPVFPKI